MTPFEFAIPWILYAEGGYTAGLPNDPGGETNFGVSKRYHPTVDIKNLTRDAALDILKREYWDINKLHLLPAGVAIMMWDAGILQGPKTAVRILQSTVGVVVDGVLGAATADAAKTAPHVLRRFTDARMLRFTEAANFPEHKDNWLPRALKCWAYCEGVPL